jgi:hypothetical protein
MYRRIFAVTGIAILSVLISATVSLGQGSIVVNCSGMDQYPGKMLSARVVDVSIGREVERITFAAITEESLELFFTPLLEGNSYHIDLYIDFNENGRYDSPPLDRAWRIVVEELSGEASPLFTPTDNYTDIDWPPTIDGVIDPDGYRHSMTDGGTEMMVYWQNDEYDLYVGLISPGTGWAAIGFSPTRRMQGANIVIGAVTEDGLVIEDHFGASPVSHRSDKQPQIWRAGGREADGKTVIEFAIPLRSEDPNDVVLEPGTDVTIILAYHRSSDRLSARHTRRNTTSITLDKGEE